MSGSAMSGSIPSNATVKIDSYKMPSSQTIPIRLASSVREAAPKEPVTTYTGMLPSSQASINDTGVAKARQPSPAGALYQASPMQARRVEIPLSSAAPAAPQEVTEVVYSDEFITKNEFKERLENERSIYASTMQKILHTQVEKLRDVISNEVQKLNSKIDLNANILQTNMNTLSKSCEQRLQACEERLKALEFRPDVNIEVLEQLKGFSESAEQRLYRLEANEGTANQSSMRQQAAITELQEQAGTWRWNDDALQSQVDDVNKKLQSQPAAIDSSKVKALEDDMAAFHGNMTEVALQLEGLKTMWARDHEADVKQIEVRNSLTELSARMGTLHDNVQVQDVRIRQLELKGNDVNPIDTIALRQQIELLTSNLEDEVARRCRTSADAESRWRLALMEIRTDVEKEVMEIRTDVEKERTDREEAVGNAMGPIPVLITITGASELRDSQMSEEIDPYCVCEIPNKGTFNTIALKGMDTPSWEESFEMNDFAYGDQLNFYVFDANTYPRQPACNLGKVTLQGKDVYSNGFEGELKLSGSGWKANGYVKVRIEKLQGTCHRKVDDDKEGGQGMDDIVMVLHRQQKDHTALVSELSGERHERIEADDDLREHISALVKEEAKDRAASTNNLEAYFKREIASLRS